MKRLADCEYTATISYAVADDEAWFGWVTHFGEELRRGLSAMLRGVKVPPMFLAGEGGLVAGTLSDEMRQRISASFAMIVVVHENYVHSPWAAKELAYFRSLSADDGALGRLYIVALSESAMLELGATADWKRLFPNSDQLWMPFYDPADKERPLDIYMAPGLVSPGFRAPFERLRSDLAWKLKQSAAAPPPPAPAPAALPAAQPARASEGKAAPVVFVSHAAEDAAWAEAVVATLEAEGLGCWLASRDIVPGAVAYAGEIVKALKRCRSMVILVSQHASASAHVVREVTMAYDRNLPVLPLKIDDAPLGDSLEYFFTAGQVLHVARLPRDEALRLLLRSLRRLDFGST